MSAAAGESPFIESFNADKVTVEIARGADGNSWLPLQMRRDRMIVRGAAHAAEVELYFRRTRVIGDVVVVGSYQRMVLARGRGDSADLAVGLPADVRFVDPARALATDIACRELSAFAATGPDAKESIGFVGGDVPHRFSLERVSLATTPGGPAVATLGTRERDAYVIEQRGAFTRVWFGLAETHDVALIGWVPFSVVSPTTAREELTGWGTIGTSGPMPKLRHCVSTLVVWLVRVGKSGRVEVGEIATGTDLEIAADPDVPPGTLALGRHTIGWLRLADDARLVIDAAACPEGP